MFLQFPPERSGNEAPPHTWSELQRAELWHFLIDCFLAWEEAAIRCWGSGGRAPRAGLKPSPPPVKPVPSASGKCWRRPSPPPPSRKKGTGPPTGLRGPSHTAAQAQKTRPWLGETELSSRLKRRLSVCWRRFFVLFCLACVYFPTSSGQMAD